MNCYSVFSSGFYRKATTPDFEIRSFTVLPQQKITADVHEFKITWIKQGNGSHRIGNDDFAFNPLQIFFLAPGQTQSLTHAASGLIIRLSEPFINRLTWRLHGRDITELLYLFTTSNGTVIAPKTADTLEEVIERMQMLLATGDALQDDILGLYMEIFMDELYQSSFAAARTKRISSAEKIAEPSTSTVN